MTHFNPRFGEEGIKTIINRKWLRRRSIQNYFPQADGSIVDCDGNILAESDDDTIEYDGGYFYAELSMEEE